MGALHDQAPRDAPLQPWLSPAALRHLCIGLILAEQDRLIRTSAIGASQRAKLTDPALSDADREALFVDADTLGFDSLGLLDLILVLNGFFGLHRTGIEDYLLVRRRIGDWVDLLGEHLRRAPHDLALTFQTSGSTGAPKAIAHPFARLRTEVTASLGGPLAMLRPDARVLALVPPHHIYGFLFTVLLPSLAGFGIVDLHRAGPGAALREARPGDLVVGTPLHWRNLNQLNMNFAPGVHGVVSAGPSEPATWDAVRHRGLASLTEIFGATETAGLAARTGPDAPFVLMSHLRRDGDGIAGRDGPRALQDHLNWVDDATFFIAGRQDEVVQVAGVNVAPAHVRDRIITVAGVTDAAVRLDGDRLKAFVQTDLPTAAHGALCDQVRAALRQALPAAACPHAIRCGDALPRNAMGKLADWSVAEVASTANGSTIS